ncbi:ADP-ribose pyrophosphatase YjhB (NUDIX family) [Collimonas sp. PA-H2]|uniref:NUDIX hydrolase n=1 Tax=Collimonas sp. PA-H2 TaxID=1881062 RepID=UPI000BF5CCCC|nr:NUDIX hydrolase [Collimonas sp. PA-H2]PFH10516.1 ADP-ribose pyrophosphatase YjhB (NUDIX family) [Collimonas sp. PA-H2]
MSVNNTTNAADLRRQIRAEFSSIQPLDTLEQTHIAEALEWLDSGAELCRQAKPATPPQHLVSYFVVVDDGHALLVDHRNAQLWLPPGGHVEPGEHPRTTVLRELEEELGFSASHAIQAPVLLTATTTVGLTAGHTDVSLWYVVRASRAQKITFDEKEFNAVRWFPFAELPLERSDPHMDRFLRKLCGAESATA